MRPVGTTSRGLPESIALAKLDPSGPSTPRCRRVRLCWGSESTSSTLNPWVAAFTATFAEIVDLPTPPLPTPISTTRLRLFNVAVSKAIGHPFHQAHPLLGVMMCTL